jgi:hypothetical protein
MTYSIRQPVGYLGLGTSATDTSRGAFIGSSGGDDAGASAARDFVAKNGGTQREFDRTWFIFYKDTDVGGRLAKLNGAMRRMRFTPITWDRVGSIEGMNWEIREESPSMQRLKALWIRHGRKPAWWPGAQGEYNFGPNTNQSRVLRVSKEFYDYITNPRTPLFAPHEDGYVRMWFNDTMLDEVRAKLAASGYLGYQDAVSTKKESAFVRALRTVYEIERERKGGQLKTNGKDWWPDGFNFGVNTNGNEIRIHPDFLTFLMTQRLPVSSQSPRAGMIIKAPVYGPLPTAGPGGKPTWEVQPAREITGRPTARG